MVLWGSGGLPRRASGVKVASFIFFLSAAARLAAGGRRVEPCWVGTSIASRNVGARARPSTTPVCDAIRRRSRVQQQTGSSRCTSPMAASQGDEGGAAVINLQVTAAASHAMLPASLSTFGRLLRSSDGRPLQAVAPNADVALHLVAGKTSDGQELVAFVDPASARVNARVQVLASCAFPKPAKLTGEQACALPYYALDLLPPLMKAGVHSILEESGSKVSEAAGAAGGQERREATCVVTGCGPQAAFAIQLLRSWGYRVMGCSRRSFEEVKRWGAESVVDFSQDSFTEKLQQGSRLALVVDTLGTDVDGLASSLKRATGAAYVSTMPSSVRRMQSQGLLQGASLFTSMFVGKPETPATTAYWLPEQQGRDVVQYALQAAEAGVVGVPGKGVSMEDYMDAILWPKDAESDYRFGFPAGAVAGEGPASGLSDAELLKRYTQAALGEGAGELDVVLKRFKAAFQRLVPPEGGGEEGGRQGATVVFVTAPNCKVCMYTKPKVLQLAEEFRGVQFLHLVADPDKYMVAEMLAVKSYPYFIVYSPEGERLSTYNALGPDLVKQVFMMARLNSSRQR